MRSVRTASGIALGLVISIGLGCGEPRTLDPRGDEIGLHFELIDNLLPESSRFSARLTLSNDSSTPLGRNWRLFFNFGKDVIAESLPATVTATHINGDFWRLAPTADFEPLAPGEEHEIPFHAEGRLIKESDAPAGPYFVFLDAEGQPSPAEPVSEITIAGFDDPRRIDLGLGEKLPPPTPERRYEEYRLLEKLLSTEIGRVVPTPVVSRRIGAEVVLDAAWVVSYQEGLETEADLLAETLGTLLDGNPAVQVLGDGATSRAVVLEIGEVDVAGERQQPGDEAYRLAVGESEIRIVGSDAAGVFYGTRTLTALVPVGAWREPRAALELEGTIIEDAPRFGYRGLHLDVARNFQSPETVKRLLEAASFYKLNRFHFHLSDDEGWRLAVEGLPELVEVGGRRGHTEDELDHLVPSYGSGPDPEDSRGSGHYTRAEMVELLQYARDRHIQVIPEIDLPGHARAAIKAMKARSVRLSAGGDDGEASRHLLTDPGDRSEYRSVQGWNDNVVDACRESTYDFVETVLDEIIEIWAEAGAPLDAIHVGGDEVPVGVWKDSPACRQLIADDDELDGPEDLAGYFLRRVSDMLAERGLTTAGWEEIALTTKLWDGHHVKEPDPALVERRLRPYVWNNVWGWGAEDLGYRLANTGYEVVLCGATNLYFDLAYDMDPREPGYGWAGFVDTRKPWEFVPFDVFKNASHDLAGNPLDPERDFKDRTRPTPEGRARILGIQGQLWGENSKSREILEYQAFPKLLGLAERAWARQPAWAREESKAERERQRAVAWNEFANRLGQRELPRLDGFLGGIAYRLPPPGATLAEGVLETGVAFPGLAVHYTTDGSPPRADSPRYEGPVGVEGEVRLVTVDSRGRVSRVAVVGERLVEIAE